MNTHTHTHACTHAHTRTRLMPISHSTQKTKLVKKISQVGNNDTINIYSSKKDFLVEELVMVM